MTESFTITVNSHWRSNRLGIEVKVTRVTLHAVCYVALDNTFSGRLWQGMFLQDFQPVTEGEKKGQF
jgi:hypothetical protein